MSIDRLSAIGDALRSLAALSAVAAATQGASAAEAQSRQNTIDSVLCSVTEAESAMDPADDETDFTISDVNAAVYDLRIRNALLQPGVPRDVLISVTASAQYPELFLSCGAILIDPPAGETFVIEVRGRSGQHIVTVTSQATLQSVAQAINSPQQGIQAVAAGTGIRMFIGSLGSTQFVSVRVISSHHFTAPNAGIYTRHPTTFVTAFDAPAAFAGVTGFGRDMTAFIDGVPAVPYEFGGIKLLTPEFSFGLRLNPAPINGVGAQAICTFRAFRINP